MLVCAFNPSTVEAEAGGVCGSVGRFASLWPMISAVSVHGHLTISRPVMRPSVIAERGVERRERIAFKGLPAGILSLASVPLE